MRNKYKIAVCLLVSILCVGWHTLQAQFSCKAEARSEVAVGEYFQLRFVLNDKPSGAPRLNLQNFSVVNGPSISSSSSVSIINGKTTSEHSYTYTYTLAAQKEGTFTIPAVTFSSGNEQARSNALTIRVTSASSQGSSGGYQAQAQQPQRSQAQQSSASFNKNDYFIRATASNASPYVGEQVVVHYKLYISAQSSGYQASINSMPSANGCWTYELGDKNAEPKRTVETINGKQYYVTEIRSIAAYPQKEGTIKLSPLELDLLVQVIVQQQRASTGDPFFDAFFGGGITNIPQNMELKLKSNEISLHVKSLPKAGQPADFSGLVGSFTMRSELTKTALPANDATNLKITISGSGNLQYVNAPELNVPADIDVHEPKITDNIHTTVSGVSGSRTFEYILIPRNAGKYTLEPVTFTYYDKAKGKYVTLTGSGYTLNVSKAKGGSTVYSSTGKEDIKILGTDIRYIKTDKNIKKNHFYIVSSPIYWLLLLLPFIAILVTVILMRKKIQENRNMAVVRGKKAAQTAKKRLKKAEKLLQMGNNNAFYEEISQVLWGYVSDKFHLPLSQLSLDTAEEKLLERNMDANMIAVFINTLKDCEYVRYAPSSDITPQKMYDQTFEFITKLENELKV